MKTEINWINSLPKGRLGIAPRPRGGDWLSEEARAWHAAGVDCVVSALTPAEEAELDLLAEETTCRDNGMRFLALPIPDRGVPPSPTAFRHVLAQVMASLVAGQTVLVHCRQGIGRAALIAASVLAALGESPDAAFARVQRARGRPVPDTEEQREWVRHSVTSAAPVPSTRRPFRRTPAPKVHA